MPDGSLRVGRQKEGGHLGLSQGSDVLAAGSVDFRSGKIRFIDNSSGHYQPKGDSPRLQAEKAFEKAGFDVTGKYIERFQ
jgi:filamentous hemagglutinin